MPTIRDMIEFAKNLIGIPGDVFPGMTRKAYGEGLLEKRTRGSLTERPFTALDHDLELERLEAPCIRAGNTAYRCEGALALGGVVGAKPLNKLTRQELNRVKLRLGDHGPELYVDVPADSLKPVDTLTFIVEEAYLAEVPVENDDGETEMVEQPHKILAAWFPGFPTGDVDDATRDEFATRLKAGENTRKLRDEFIKRAPVDVGVKLHNG